MTAADTSTWIAYLQGENGADVDLLDRELERERVLMPPAVLVELLSDPEIADSTISRLTAIPMIEPGPEYWARAGRLRSGVLAQGRKARLGDALIAQSCLDADVPLITRDRDFRAFAELAGLELAV